MILASRLPRSAFSRHLRHNSTALLNPFPPSVSTHLQTHGYAVFDSFLPSHITASLRREIDSLFLSGHLLPNATHIVSASSTTTFTKRNVLEAELSQLPLSTLSSLPTLSALSDDPTVPALLSVHAPRFTLTEQALKVQRAEGAAACFPIHVDSSPSVDNRVVTALLYLNDIWEPKSDGGQLRLYNSPTNVVDIDPVNARLVLLASTGMHHRVLPSFKQRYVITMWCSGTIRKTSSHVPDDATIEHRAAFKLLEPRFKDMAFRLLLFDEWERSLWEAHPEDAAREAVEMHTQHLDLVRERLPSALCKELGENADLDKVQRLVREPRRLADVFRELETRHSNAFAFRW